MSFIGPGEGAVFCYIQDRNVLERATCVCKHINPMMVFGKKTQDRILLISDGNTTVEELTININKESDLGG
ncbi:hypothetical protein CWI38_0152p0010 [Hamiltosporidium tvaerminnensis]|uniref:Uncharacterized protein n=1 Tax=Hamiltosporidium tvaerminnensis TaxID=1176355 RepID=A0A4Q9M207_9MICR|nr:hypothetical protein CWI38_0152p0010 [Hamiltosporidium tvaerminnensis]